MIDKEEAMENEVYINAKELAAYLKLNVQTIYRNVRAKNSDTLPRIRIGGAIRFSKNAIDKWLHENSKKLKEDRCRTYITA